MLSKAVKLQSKMNWNEKEVRPMLNESIISKVNGILKRAGENGKN
jgi:hypothetical protein